MIADAYRFADSLAGRAAYLWLQPQPVVPSPIMQTWSHDVGRTAAVTGLGRTVVGWRNFVFVFRAASPDHGTITELLRTMPSPDAALEEDQGSNWMDPASERFLLGPESLARFAPEIPPSMAAFRLGGWGRIARFEMPSGAVTRIVFEYADEATAYGRLAAFESLRGVRARALRENVSLSFAAQLTESMRMSFSLRLSGATAKWSPSTPRLCGAGMKSHLTAAWPPCCSPD